MSQSRGYPIGALFVLVAACAVLAAGVTPVVRQAADGSLPAGQLFAAAASGAGFGIILGAVLGVLYYRALVGLLLGISAGAVIGLAAGTLALLPGDNVVTAAAAMTAGSALVVGIAFIMRRAE